MDGGKQARALISYNRWANERVLACASALDAAALDATRGVSYESLRGTLAHILMAQENWRARWVGAPRPPAPPSDFDALRAAFDASHEAYAAFGASMTDAEWERVIAYSDSSGKAQAEPLGLLITHAVNHGTFHRGEAGLLLAEHGRSPGDLDYVFFMREAAS